MGTKAALTCLAMAMTLASHSSAENLTPLNWDQAVAAARRNNPDLQSAVSALEAARANYRGTFSDFLPQISADGSHSRSHSAGATSDEHAYSLSARQTLFSGFKTVASVSQSRAQTESAQADLSLTGSQTLFDLRSAFVNLLYSQENIALLEKIQSRREENRRLIELRYQAGRENLGSLLRARAQLSDARFELERAQREQRTLRRRLSSLINAPGFEAGTVTGTFQVRTDSAEPDITEIALQTPRYQRAARQLAIAETGVQSAWSDFFPSVSVSGSGRRRGDKFPPENDSWSVGASISYAVFSGNRNRFNLEQSKYSRDRANQNLVSARRSAEVSVEESYQKLQDALGQTKVQNEFLEAAQERASIARAQYTNGLISFQDWDIIEGDLINAQKQNLSALRNGSLAEADWQLSIGKGFQ